MNLTDEEKQEILDACHAVLNGAAESLSKDEPIFKTEDGADLLESIKILMSATAKISAEWGTEQETVH